MSDFTLHRNSFGRLELTQAGEPRGEIVAIRAFPIAAPDEGISLVSRDGHELAWIDRLADLPAATRTLIEEELGGREFMPVIEQLERVSSFATPSTWFVRTNRGHSAFVLRGEEDIRLLGEGALLIADSHGIQFMIKDIAALDKHSRKLLDRFL